MIETLPALAPPGRNGTIAIATDQEWPDEITLLGDQIAFMSPNKAKELYDYLEFLGVAVQ